ncbi:MULTISPECIES: bifunctional DNA primase/polymerase [unclassified Gordonia (in: high G+C Gram-positive bacteria)]|uniref:bifunctional DNA primase/polymerase n=1 Tax=unclassified Gordonia (in: high G+C Gram-positive bacteria) TaxID=2657482 RepID=UPI001966C947|nr:MULTISPECIES: bifunctional DNA primase/polymerase [unclassified Gordonia (in: high G+C Gram-positive bacteria)]MBN0974257.1 bifunctional DNA primase/polymerase [Gordonia sp. BP-119]MBN0981907.1 bifunctional DNA primase/polymerase [Gordonia sp. BP-94]
MPRNEKRRPVAEPDAVPAITSREQEMPNTDDTSTVGYFARLAHEIADVIPGATVGPLIGKAPTTPSTPSGFYDFIAVDDPAFPEMARAADADHRVTGIGHRPVVGHAWFDIDAYKPGVAEKFATFARAVDLPETLAIETGRGGRHLVFALPDYARESGLSVPDGSGIDAVRTHWTGYLVGPSSLHPDTLMPYRFAESRLPIAELPPDAVAALTSSRRVRGRVTRSATDDVALWVRRNGGGRPSVMMRRAVRDLGTMREAAHDTMRNAVWRCLRLADEGHPGAQVAVGKITAAFLAEMTRREHAGLPGVRTPDEALAEIADAVAGAVAHILADREGAA